MNIYQIMSRLKDNQEASSRAASSSTSTPEERITEMVNGLLVSKRKPTTAKEPVVIDLQ